MQRLPLDPARRGAQRRMNARNTSTPCWKDQAVGGKADRSAACPSPCGGCALPGPSEALSPVQGASRVPGVGLLRWTQTTAATQGKSLGVDDRLCSKRPTQGSALWLPIGPSLGQRRRRQEESRPGSLLDLLDVAQP